MLSVASPPPRSLRAARIGGVAASRGSLDRLPGDGLIILGGILDGAVFQKERVTREEIWRTLDRIFTPRLRKAPFLLWLGADGLPTPLDRFLAVRDWVNNRGGYMERHDCESIGPANR